MVNLKKIILLVILLIVFSTTVTAGNFFNENWYLNVEENRLTDEVDIYMYNSKDPSNRLVFRYDGDPYFYITADSLGSNDIIYRFDYEDSVEDEWEKYPDKNILIFKENDTHNLKEFFEKMQDSDEFVIGYFTDTSQMRMLRYDLKGFKELLDKYMDKIEVE